MRRTGKEGHFHLLYYPNESPSVNYFKCNYSSFLFLITLLCCPFLSCIFLCIKQWKKNLFRAVFVNEDYLV